jgi:serine-type D-Ala-D-Ala carboxypeptidase/endopeptidase
VSLEDDVARLGARGHRGVVAGVLAGGEREVRGWSAAGPAPDGASLFEIGSITKAFTGVLLADLHLRGEVTLGDRLSRHLPGPWPAWRSREPTLLELATHRSGLPNVPGPLRSGELRYLLGLGGRHPWAGVTAERYAALVAAERPSRAPGGRVRYSSMGVALLGEALAHRAGTTYEALLRERVLDPLGMPATAVHVRPEDAGRLRTGHSRRGAARPPMEDHLAPAGSLRSSAEEMLTFLAACADPPPGPLGAALRLARRPHHRASRRFAFGLCWVLVRRRGRPEVAWHNGGTWGFRAYAGVAPEAGRAAVVLSDTGRGVDRTGFTLVEGR